MIRIGPRKSEFSLLKKEKIGKTCSGGRMATILLGGGFAVEWGKVESFNSRRL